MLNQLIERLVEEGYLKLSEEPSSSNAGQPGMGVPEVSEPLPRNVKFEVTEKGLDFLGYRRSGICLQFGQEFYGTTRHGAIFPPALKRPRGGKPYEFGDTIISM